MRLSTADRFVVDDGHPFSYAKLSAMAWDAMDSQVNFEGYSAYIEADADSNFITLERNDPRLEKKEIFSQSISKGLKIHMSISDLRDEDSNLVHVWELVYKTVMEHQIKKVKIIKNNARVLMRSGGDKVGKEITWYFFKDKISSGQVQEFLKELTEKFVLNGIVPGPVALHDHGVIEGGNYFSFRNEKTIVGAYIPFADVVIQVSNQPPRSLPPEVKLLSAISGETHSGVPRRMVMEDSDFNQSRGYNGADGPDDDDPSCCSGGCK
jgi:hypothetical protein